MKYHSICSTANAQYHLETLVLAVYTLPHLEAQHSAIISVETKAMFLNHGIPSQFRENNETTHDEIKLIF